MGKRQHVKCSIPGGKPGILPFVRHRNHVPAVDMLPIVISSRPATGRRHGRVLISSQPVLDDVLIELFGPEQPRGHLASNTFSILIEASDS